MAVSSYVGTARIDRPFKAGCGPQLADHYEVYPSSCFMKANCIGTFATFAEAHAAAVEFSKNDTRNAAIFPPRGNATLFNSAQG